MHEGLGRWQPFWDQARAQRYPEAVFGDDRIMIATDFECGNGCHPRREGGGYAVDLEPEPGSHRFGGMSYYFCLGVQNRTGRPLQVDLRIQAAMQGKFAEGTRSVVLRRGAAWGHLEADRIRPVADRDAVDLALELPVDATPLFVSNFHWHPYSELAAWAEALRPQPRVRVSILCRSLEGRAIYRIDIGREDAGAPVIMMCQTPQPSEATGTHVCRALVEYLLGDAPAAIAIRSAHRVVVVPATNPDGTVMGLGVSHPSGRFPFFDGRLAADGDLSSLPETRALWNLLVQERPWWFVEWHANNWARRPGHMLLRYRPSLLADAERRRLWERIDEQFLALPHTHHGNWTDHQQGLYQDTLGFQAATRLGCIAHMIKHHDKHPLAECCSHATECLLRATAAWAGQEQAHGRTSA